MDIKPERPQDWRKVENLTREAFWNIYRPGCTEHFVLNQYRDNPVFIPELDFVMEEGGHIVGHVMFSKAEITLTDGTMFPSWTFGPISIHPDYKRKGYGLKLLQYALEKARKEKHLIPGQLPQFCQSCGMHLSKDEDCGRNADGSINFDYCQYCYQDGRFLQECS